MPESPKRDPLGAFLTEYAEYLDGSRSYSDLPTFPSALTSNGDSSAKTKTKTCSVDAEGRTDGQGNPINPDGRYFVQDARPGVMVGNCASWWRPDGGGYTCNLDDAGIYRGARVLAMRETDVPWIESYIREHVVVHVRADTQALDRTHYRPGPRGAPPPTAPQKRPRRGALK
jgi:hypothetical protein